MKKELMIEGMKCEGCASTVAEKFQAINGVERVMIDLDSKTATVESQNEIDEPVFQEALADTKYEVVPTAK